MLLISGTLCFKVQLGHFGDNNFKSEGKGSILLH